MNAKSAGFLAMVATFTPSDSVNTLASGYLGADTMRSQVVAACIALCATMVGATKAGEVVTAVLCLREDEGRADEGESLARSLYSSIRKGVGEAGHAFTLSQKTTDGRPAWVGAEVSASAAKSKAASGKRAPRAGKRERDDEAAVKALHRIREAAGLPRNMRNDDTANAIIALLATLKPAASVSGKLPRIAKRVAA